MCIRDRYLGSACREEKLMAFCVTEPEAGSDVAAMTTAARRRKGGYVLSGRKCFITGGGVADYYIVFATVDPSRGHRGITAFIVPREAEGLSVGKKEDKMGQRAACLLYTSSRSSAARSAVSRGAPEPPLLLLPAGARHR